jgi:hypothetical protein
MKKNYKSRIVAVSGHKKDLMGYECIFCKKFQKKVTEFKENECPDNFQHNFRPVYRSLSVKLPFWVVLDLVEEKKQWEEDAKLRREELPDYERWIIDNLSEAVALIRRGALKDVKP